MWRDSERLGLPDDNHNVKYITPGRTAWMCLVHTNPRKRRPSGRSNNMHILARVHCGRSNKRVPVNNKNRASSHTAQYPQLHNVWKLSKPITASRDHNNIPHASNEKRIGEISGQVGKVQNTFSSTPQDQWGIRT